MALTMIYWQRQRGKVTDIRGVQEDVGQVEEAVAVLDVEYFVVKERVELLVEVGVVPVV